MVDLRITVLRILLRNESYTPSPHELKSQPNNVGNCSYRRSFICQFNLSTYRQYQKLYILSLFSEYKHGYASLRPSILICVLSFPLFVIRSHQGGTVKCYWS